ncbi:MAG: dUTP diphosphatase [Bullifex sp.]
MDEVKITLKEGAFAPSYESRGSAGADVHAYLPDGAIVIEPGKAAMIPTGIRAAIPDGFELQVRPRSGLALKKSITVLNTPGTIDSDYRGEIGIILINHSGFPFTVNHGDRIAQLVFARYARAVYTVVSELDETERGSGGFGSTGV